MEVTTQQKQQMVEAQMDALSDADIVALVAELPGDRARHVAHLVQRRMKQLRLRTVVSAVATALLIGG